MKKYMHLSWLFAGLAVLLSDVMCATIAYDYCNLLHCAGCSAPPSVAFVFAVPYGAGIVICAALAWFFHRQYRKTV